MKPMPAQVEGWLELRNGAGSCNIALHQAASTQKSGAAIKIVFGVADVRKFKKEREEDGLKFGPIHEAEDFEFANAKDPAGNSVQISSRGLNRAVDISHIDKKHVVMHSKERMKNSTISVLSALSYYL